MKCPYCGHEEDRVLDSRPLEGASIIRRRRECQACHKRFTTYERLEEVPLMVIKSNDRREPFNREKLREGILRACEKRPIGPLGSPHHESVSPSRETPLRSLDVSNSQEVFIVAEVP